MLVDLSNLLERLKNRREERHCIVVYVSIEIP